MPKQLKKATFAAGCFWGVEAAFQNVKGIVSTQAGYSGGITIRPTYKDICTDTTGHAEVVQVEYDPEQISYEELLDIFWKCHDPTLLNRQGSDVGTQYRSAIFYHDEKQKAIARASKEILQKKLKSKIVTEIVQALEFYAAEEYHQKYLQKRGLHTC